MYLYVEILRNNIEEARFQSKQKYFEQCLRIKMKIEEMQVFHNK